MAPKNNDGKVSFEEYAQRSSRREILMIMKIQYLIMKTGSQTLFLSGTRSCDIE